jgi:hypothetical protein
LRSDHSRRRERHQQTDKQHNLAHSFFQIPESKIETQQKIMTQPRATALTKCLAERLLRFFRLLLLLVLVGVGSFGA